MLYYWLLLPMVLWLLQWRRRLRLLLYKWRRWQQLLLLLLWLLLFLHLLFLLLLLVGVVLLNFCKLILKHTCLHMHGLWLQDPRRWPTT